MAEFEVNEIAAPVSNPTAAQARTGQAHDPVLLVSLYSEDEWERFTREWLQAVKNSKSYAIVAKLSGAGDRGLDVVGFTQEEAFDAPWDSFQCKRYDHPLYPSDIWIELGKIIYFSFAGEEPFDGKQQIPCKHLFVAPKDVGLSAQKLFLSPEKLKAGLIKNWSEYVETEKLGKGIIAPLDGDLAKYVEKFDFSIFGFKSVADVIDEHKATPYHVTRFGAAFPEKPKRSPIPSTPTTEETVYIRRLLEAYSDNKGVAFAGVDELDAHDDLAVHFRRQRELFYDAEFLKGYARDTVPEGVFDGLSDDIYSGVIDTVEKKHACGLTRVRETISCAATVDVSGNALHQVATVREKQGICHQLANEDRLKWV